MDAVLILNKLCLKFPHTDKSATTAESTSNTITSCFSSLKWADDSLAADSSAQTLTSREQIRLELFSRWTFKGSDFKSATAFK